MVKRFDPKRTTRLALATTCLEGRDSTIELRPHGQSYDHQKQPPPKNSGAAPANGMEAGGFAPPC